jgi:hypothetical protein
MIVKKDTYFTLDPWGFLILEKKLMKKGTGNQTSGRIPYRD